MKFFLHAEQPSPTTTHYQSKQSFNLNYNNTNTRAMQSPGVTDPNVPLSTPMQVEEIDDAGISDVAQVSGTNYQNSVHQTNIQTAAEKQQCKLNDMTVLQHHIQPLNQLLQEQQKKIKDLEEKVNMLNIQQKQHHDNFKKEISRLQQEIDKMKQKDQNKQLTKEVNQLNSQTARNMVY